MKTVRLGEELESKLDQLARRTGRTVSEIVREAVRNHCEMATADSLAARLADVTGTVSSGGGDSRKTGRRFTEAVARRAASKPRNQRRRR
jgi:predicted DNA-binding protein